MLRFAVRPHIFGRPIMTTSTRWTLGVAILVASVAITAAVAQLASAPASQPAVALPPPVLKGSM
jgi:hypothetical protein